MRISRTWKSLFLLVLIFVQNGQILCDKEFSTEEQEEIERNSERHEFQAEVGRLMDIIINSLYTQKEIFLREIISNASDALDKIRFMAVSNPEVLGEQTELSIRIEYDSDAKTITITDTGIGMTKQDLIHNLGTVAKSGTTNFIEAIKGGNLNLIGQFGVGFYSTFLAGSKVTVISKNNDDEQYIWESSAAHSFNVLKDPRGDTLKRGSKVTIHLKQDAYEFSEEEKIKALVRKYSEFINFPIYLRTKKEVTKEVPIEEEEEEEEKKEEEPKDDVEVSETVEKKEKVPKTKTVKENVWEWVLVNDNKAIWLRSKDQIEEEEYCKFYKALTKESEDPLTYMHFMAEGEVEFKSILFIPKKAASDMFENYYSKSAGLKLYVRRVLINEEFDELMPRYLNFIKGVVDSDELPLNVSRESLQQLKMMKVISRKLVRKTLEMLKKLAESKEDEDKDDEEEEEEDEELEETEKKTETEKEGEEEETKKESKTKEKEDRYLNFWKEFGKNIKLGIVEDPANRSKLAKLTRWFSSRNITEVTSFDEYISRAKTGQDYIYFIAGDNKETLMKSPILQALLKKGYEVLLLDDPIDEFAFQHLSEYERKKLVNVAKGEFRFPDDDDSGRKKIKKIKKLYQPLTDWWRKQESDLLESVVVSQRLVDDPCVIVSSEHGYSANMERISKAQAYANPERQNMNSGSKKILEINAGHPIMKELLERVKESPDTETEELVRTLTETALINSGYQLENPHEYAKRFFKLFNGAMGISKDAAVEEVEVGVEEEEEEEKKEEGQERESIPVEEEEGEDRKAKDDL